MPCDAFSVAMARVDHASCESSPMPMTRQALTTASAISSGADLNSPAMNEGGAAMKARDAPVRISSTQYTANQPKGGVAACAAKAEKTRVAGKSSANSPRLSATAQLRL